MCDSIALAANGCLLTRITPLANSAAMSLCLASLLTNYLRSECLERLQNPAFWRRRTQRGVCRKRNQAARVKSLRDCPKQVRLHRKIRSDSSCNSRSAATHRWMPRSMISAIDRKRTDAGSRGSSSSAGRESREKASMVLPPWKDLRGNRNGIPPRSIYAKRPTRVPLPNKNFATQGQIVRDNQWRIFNERIF